MPSTFHDALRVENSRSQWSGEQLAKPAGPEFVMAPTHTITDLLKEGRFSSLGQ